MTTVFIISAPSGSGKSTLVSRLLNNVPGLMFSVSFTTRKPRGAEVNGQSYRFVSREDFEGMIERGEFLDIDVQGARQLKDRIPGAVRIFILAPSREILEQRLRARSEDRDEVIARRLRDAADEIRQYDEYDYVLINRDLAESDATLKAIVCAERVRRSRIEDRIRPILDTFQA
jgi:guanylate kinase